MSCFVTSGLLFSDMAEISCGSETKTENGGEAVEVRGEGKLDSILLIKLPYAGADLTVYLIFSLYEPWMSPEMIFSDAQFSLSVTCKDLEEQVPTHNHI